MRYGLGLRERKYYEFQAMDLGTVMHGALELYADYLRRRQISWMDLTEEQQRELIDECVDRIAADYGSTILHSSARNEYMITRMKRILRRTVWALKEQMVRG